MFVAKCRNDAVRLSFPERSSVRRHLLPTGMGVYRHTSATYALDTQLRQILTDFQKSFTGTPNVNLQ